MDFVRARTQQQIEQRQADIIAACDTLFEQGGYDQVNIKAISEMTTITRSSIYTYYKTKDEIILDLLRTELLSWQDELLLWGQETAPLSRAAFCKDFTSILLKKDKMLQHYCLLYTFLETNCRIEKLVSFKQSVVPVMGTLVQILMMSFPDYTIEQASLITEEIVSYILGLYPSTHLTAKQQEALVLSNTGYHTGNFATLCEIGVAAFLGCSTAP